MPDEPRTAPSDPIQAIFSDQVLARLNSRPHKSSRLADRLAILSAHGGRALILARRQAWANYLGEAFMLGLFDDPHGSDLRARLTGVDDNAFHSALKECMIGWVLSCKLGLDVLPRPEGRPGCVLEYLIRHGSDEIRVEVKAPYHAFAIKGAWGGDSSDLLAGCIDQANSQFEQDVPNLLALAPELGMPVYRWRHQLIEAFYGKEVITVPLDMMTGVPAGPTAVQFRPDGRFLRRRTPRGALFKPDGTPAYTRVGAVLCVEESDDARGNVEHIILLAHNPYAAIPITRALWGPIPQLIDVGDDRSIEMVWTDSPPSADHT